MRTFKNTETLAKYRPKNINDNRQLQYTSKKQEIELKQILPQKIEVLAAPPMEIKKVFLPSPPLELNCNPQEIDIQADPFLKSSGELAMKETMIFRDDDDSPQSLKGAEKNTMLSRIVLWWNKNDKWQTLVRWFSLQESYQAFITVRKHKEGSDYAYMDGLKFYSMLWVILGHVFLTFLSSRNNNRATLLPFVASPPLHC